jgi:hypothetical protein
MCGISRERSAFVFALAALVVGLQIFVTARQMDLSQASGVPLPAADLPAGTVSVRVVRGSFANNLANETVTFTVNGQDRTMTTDAGGRVQVADLPKGARVRAAVTIDGARIQSQEITIADSGIRFVLVAGVAGAPAAPAALPGAAPVAGTVSLGGDSRIVIDFAEERLNVYYVVQVLNGGGAPVDVGGPLVFELPQGARGATVMEGSTANATANGPRVTVTGPFAPGRTDVNIAFELPYSGNAARLEQVWPADAAPFTILAVKTGNMDLSSPQITGKENTSQQGQSLVAGMTVAVKKDGLFAADITGLPAHAVWPRNLAFGTAGLIALLGLWAAFGPSSARARA